jgi:hypothetical protein
LIREPAADDFPHNQSKSIDIHFAQGFTGVTNRQFEKFRCHVRIRADLNEVIGGENWWKNFREAEISQTETESWMQSNENIRAFDVPMYNDGFLYSMRSKIIIGRDVRNEGNRSLEEENEEMRNTLTKPVSAR